MPLRLTDRQSFGERRRAEVERLAAAEVRRRFDLQRGPLFRTSLFRLGANEHILLLVAHRIVMDNDSMSVVQRELEHAYEALCAGRQPDLPAPPSRFQDYVRAERDRLARPEFGESLAYWSRRLSGELPILQLPADRPGEAGKPGTAVRINRELPPDLREAVKQFSHHEGLTVFETLLAAFKALLHRYSGQTDLIVATPFSTRDPGDAGLVGPFTDTLILRTDLSGDPPFRELAARVHETVAGAMAHREVPFQKVLDLLPANSKAGLSFLSAFFSLDKTAGPELPPDGALACDLWVRACEGPAELSISIEYNARVFERTTVERLFGHYETLLRDAATAPGRSVGKLPLLTAAERKQLLFQWNHTAAEFPSDCSVLDLFERQARRTPSATAVVFGDRALTYAEIDGRATALAAIIAAHGGGPRARIGISMERSPEVVIALLAVWKAGSAYLPLDPSYPAERLAFMADHAQVPIVLTQKRVLRRIAALRDRALVVDGVGPAVSTPTTMPSPGDVAYVLYTSGSTGKPKGVEVTHRSFVNLLTSIAHEPGFSAADTILAITTLSFDIAGVEMFLPLITGGRCALASPAAQRDPAALIRDIARYKPTLLQATPVTWRMLVEAGWAGDPGIRLFTCGETLPAELASTLLPRCCELWNLYAPTETTIYSTKWRVKPGGTILVGRPLANTTLYIVDANGEPVPVGLPGELLIGGEGVARGYLGRPELTAGRFVQDPFAGDPGARIYRTGDLARYRETGEIELLGRMDHQTKIRGFRVELGEIETVLEQHESVRQAVVMAREDRPGDRRLVAYIVPRKAGAVADAELRAHLSRSLPDYMLPAACVFLDRFPMTPSGKIHKNALPAPERNLKPGGRTSPRTSLELQLQRLWESVLGVQPVGMQDNFFETGGHSLMALRLMSRVEKTLGVGLPVSMLFQAPTIELMARLIAQKGIEPDAGVLVPIQTNGSRPPLFCIHGVGGTILSYGHLAKHLPDDQPLYGLQARGLDGIEAPHTRIEEMAADYIAHVRSVQTSGPYYFAGFSFGGLVGFEMARQLEAAGEEVGLLLLLDSGAMDAQSSLPWRVFWRAVLDRQVGRCKLHAGNLARLSTPGRIEYVRQRFRTLRRKAGNRVWQFRYRLYEITRRPVPQAFQNVKEAAYLAVRQYTPGPYSGTAVLFRAEQRSAVDDADATLGWGRLIRGGVEVRTVRGDHNTIAVGQNAATLAGQIMSVLDRARETRGEDALPLGNFPGETVTFMNGPGAGLSMGPPREL